MCVTLDDVMLQVQRIYVNKGSGWRSPMLPDITLNESEYATIEGLYR